VGADGLRGSLTLVLSAASRLIRSWIVGQKAEAIKAFDEKPAKLASREEGAGRQKRSHH
jgi:hypothetical protein